MYLCAVCYIYVLCIIIGNSHRLISSSIIGVITASATVGVVLLVAIAVILLLAIFVTILMKEKPTKDCNSDTIEKGNSSSFNTGVSHGVSKTQVTVTGSNLVLTEL